MSFRRLPFESVFADESGGNVKTPQSEYLPMGEFPVVDQGKALIGGYTDQRDRLCGQGRSAIVFGDHTRCIKYIDFPFCMGADGVKVLRPKIEADLKYLYYFLASLDIPSAGYDRHYKYLKRTEVLLPPLPEQRRIAAILDQTDAIRAMRQEALAQLDSLTQSIFNELFGDPVVNSLSWPVMCVQDLLSDAEVFTDGDWVESKDQDPEGDIRLIQLADVGDGYFIDKSRRFLNARTASRLRCTPLKPQDVLVARMPDPLGRACLFPALGVDCVTVVDVCIIRPSGKGPDPMWLMSCLNSSSFRRQIEAEATGTTRTRISRGNLSKLQIIAPPLTLQREFAARIQAVESIKATHRVALAELDALFASLQHRAFAGQLS